MSKVFPGVVAAVVLAAVLLVPTQSAAVRAPCLVLNDSFDLSPDGVVTVDGFVVQRASNGRYRTDAGLEFDVNLSSVVAIDPSSTECNNVVKAVTLTVADPFTGVTAVVEAVTP